MRAGAGNDVVDAVGNTGAASFATGAGNDSITGGTGNDTILAGGGNDSILAGDGANSVDAGTGNNTIDGGDGNDLLTGAAGNDPLTGGAGDDRFTVGSGDTITDFGAGNTGGIDNANPANNDFVDLTGYYNDANLATINAARAAAGLPQYSTALAAGGPSRRHAEQHHHGQRL